MSGRSVQDRQEAGREAMHESILYPVASIQPTTRGWSKRRRDHGERLAGEQDARRGIDQGRRVDRADVQDGGG